MVIISPIGGFLFLGGGDFFPPMLSTNFKTKGILGIIGLVLSLDQSLIVCGKVSVFL